MGVSWSRKRECVGDENTRLEERSAKLVWRRIEILRLKGVVKVEECDDDAKLADSDPS